MPIGDGRFLAYLLGLVRRSLSGTAAARIDVMSSTTTLSKQARVAIYARVSTTSRGQDVGLQLDELRLAAVQRGWLAVEYVDDGISGTKTSRPALDRMMADCRSGKVDVVAVWKLDRLGRSLQHLLAVLEDFRTWNVGFVSLRDAGMDTTTASGRLMVAMVGAFAEFERALIVERVRAGVARAQATGTHCGRPRNYIDLRAARLLLEQGVAVRQVASMLGLPRATLQRRLAECEGGPKVGVDGGVETVA